MLGPTGGRVILGPTQTCAIVTVSSKQDAVALSVAYYFSTAEAWALPHCLGCCLAVAHRRALFYSWGAGPRGASAGIRRTVQVYIRKNWSEQNATLVQDGTVLNFTLSQVFLESRDTCGVDMGAGGSDKTAQQGQTPKRRLKRKTSEAIVDTEKSEAAKPPPVPLALPAADASIEVEFKPKVPKYVEMGGLGESEGKADVKPALVAIDGTMKPEGSDAPAASSTDPHGSKESMRVSDEVE